MTRGMRYSHYIPTTAPYCATLRYTKVFALAFTQNLVQLSHHTQRSASVSTAWLPLPEPPAAKSGARGENADLDGCLACEGFRTLGLLSAACASAHLVALSITAKRSKWAAPDTKTWRAWLAMESAALLDL